MNSRWKFAFEKYQETAGFFGPQSQWAVRLSARHGSSGAKSFFRSSPKISNSIYKWRCDKRGASWDILLHVLMQIELVKVKPFKNLLVTVVIKNRDRKDETKFEPRDDNFPGEIKTVGAKIRLLRTLALRRNKVFLKLLKLLLPETTSFITPAQSNLKTNIVYLHQVIERTLIM